MKCTLLNLLPLTCRQFHQNSRRCGEIPGNIIRSLSWLPISTMLCLKTTVSLFILGTLSPKNSVSPPNCSFCKLLEDGHFIFSIFNIYVLLNRKQMREERGGDEEKEGREGEKEETVIDPDSYPFAFCSLHYIKSEILRWSILKFKLQWKVLLTNMSIAGAYSLFVTLLGSLEIYLLRNIPLSSVWIDLAPLPQAQYRRPQLFWLLSSPSRPLLFYFNLSPFKHFGIWDNHTGPWCTENCPKSTFSFVLTPWLTENIVSSPSPCFPHEIWDGLSKKNNSEENN